MRSIKKNRNLSPEVLAERKKRKFARFMGFIWGAMLVGFVACIIRLYTYSEDYSSNIEYSYQSIAEQDYGDLLNRVRLAETYGYDPEVNTEYKELCAVADYEEAAFQYKIYSENGDSKKVAYYQTKMDEAAAKFGVLDFTKEEIDEILSLNSAD